MTRIYDRDTKHFDRAVIEHLVATGQATFFAGANAYVVKTEDGTFAVRPHQIVDTGLTVPVAAVVTDVVEVRAPSPMDGYSGQECYDGEDTGPGGVVYDSMLALAQEWVARCSDDKNADPLVTVRRMLDDYEGEVEQAVREQVAGARAAARPRRGALSADQEDLLRNFL